MVKMRFIGDKGVNQAMKEQKSVAKNLVSALNNVDVKKCKGFKDIATQLKNKPNIANHYVRTKSEKNVGKIFSTSGIAITGFIKLLSSYNTSIKKDEFYNSLCNLFGIDSTDKGNNRIAKIQKYFLNLDLGKDSLNPQLEAVYNQRYKGSNIETYDSKKPNEENIWVIGAFEYKEACEAIANLLGRIYDKFLSKNNYGNATNDATLLDVQHEDWRKSVPEGADDETVAMYKELNEGITLESAFEGKDFESVVIPEGTKNINSKTFKSCHNLKSVKLPQTLEIIGQEAFSDCSSLEKITIPDNTEVILNDAFSGCNLQSVKLSKKLKCIYSGAFAFGRFRSIEIPEGVTSIEGDVFSYCDNLKKVKLPQSLQFLGGGVFWECKKLEDATIQGSIKKIPDHIFYGCVNLKSVVMPIGVTDIGEGAFKECSSLTSITIPSGVKTIGSFAFCDCSKLTSIVLPEAIKSIGEEAFLGCKNLKQITIRGKVENIGKNAFDEINKSATINEVPYLEWLKKFNGSK